MWLIWLHRGPQCGGPGFNPWVGKIPWRRERLPTPVFWPGESRGLCSPRATKSQTRLSDPHLPFRCGFRWVLVLGEIIERENTETERRLRTNLSISQFLDRDRMRAQQDTEKSRSFTRSVNKCLSATCQGQAPGWGLRWAHRTWRFPHGPHCLGEGARPLHAVPECLPRARPCSKQQGTQWEQTRSRPTGSCSTLCSVTPGTTEGSPGCCGHIEGPPGPTQPRAVREGCPERAEGVDSMRTGWEVPRKTTPRSGRAAQESRVFRGGRCQGHCCRL